MGRYPEVEHWRPVIATALMLGVVVISCMPRFWNKALPLVWLVMLTVYFVLMKGGFFGLTSVDTDQWGGLPLTVMLTVISMTLAFPLAIFVALGRRSNMPAIKTLCTLYVELVRGVPLITVLFMASFMLPLFMPEGVKIDVLVRVVVGITLVFWGVHGRSDSRWPAGLAQGPDRSGGHAGPELLANPAHDRAAPGAWLPWCHPS
jgi:general L-amino acid transport system permease protein